MMMARRFDGLGNGYDGTTRRTADGTDWTGIVHQHEDRLPEPLSWTKSRLVFVDSMSDLFHPAVDTEFIDKVFGVMALASDHIFQILTKRPERMATYMAATESDLKSRWKAAMDEVAGESVEPSYPLQNVWLGTSVENEGATTRIDHLRDIDAQVRFISFEPLIGEVETLNLEGINWVIVGGESGHNARPLEEDHVRRIKKACEKAGVPFFFKQWGGRHAKENGRELDGDVWDGMPSEARVMMESG
jgi:protein gp37